MLKVYKKTIDESGNEGWVLLLDADPQAIMEQEPNNYRVESEDSDGTITIIC